MGLGTLTGGGSSTPSVTARVVSLAMVAELITEITGATWVGAVASVYTWSGRVVVTVTGTVVDAPVKRM